MRGVIQGFFPHGTRRATSALPPHLPAFAQHGGQPLPAPVAQQMESLFGASFADVRVHVGAHAASIGALAFTQGSHVHFAQGQYDPHSVRGREIHGHELAHVVQQRAGRVPNPFASGTAIVHDARLEAEAAQMARRASALPLAPRPASAANPIQRYRILGPGSIYGRMPAKRPWRGYPYAVVEGATFRGQEIASGVGGSHSFLRTAGGKKANIVAAAGGRLSLRVSDDGNMAIEHSDLGTRQPKVFFATMEVFNAANLALGSAGSRIRLQRNGESITILTGWWETKTLYGIVPLRHSGGSANLLPQNCNAIAAEIIAEDPSWLGASSLPFSVASRISPEAFARLQAAKRNYSLPIERVLEAEEDVVRAYVRDTRRDYGPVHRERANEWVAPEIGEDYMIASLGRGTNLGEGRARLTDYATGTERTVPWRFHFAGVVARSGHDRITLENFARGDNRLEAPDPRWYFQMYSETIGQTFHETYAGTPNYANPITIRFTRR